MKNMSSKNISDLTCMVIKKLIQNATIVVFTKKGSFEKSNTTDFFTIVKKFAF